MNLELILIDRQDREDVRMLKSKINELILATIQLSKENKELKEAIKMNAKGSKL